MTTADQLAIVNQVLLEDDEKAVVLADGGLVKDWVKCQRLIVIVAKASNTHALFVFTAKNLPISVPGDLAIDTVIPMDASFKCEIDSTKSSCNIQISSRQRAKLMMEMVPGYHAQNLVGEIFRLIEARDKNKLVEIDEDDGQSFAWLLKYKNSSSSSVAENEASEGESKSTSMRSTTSMTSIGDIEEVNRQDIAMGVTPIAARESVFKYQMSLKEDQYTEIQDFTVYCATWNVNGQSPAGDVSAWLAGDPEPPDLYAIGFQELDLSKEAFVFNESPKEDEWLRAVYKSLHPATKYKKVKLVRLVGMMLVVFVRAEHEPFVANIAAETVGTGIMGKLGNKGGVSVRLDFHNTSICFVNSHLAAHLSECERRNQDYHDINARTVFGHLPRTRHIKDHDMVYWIGDLNYRVTDIDAADVKDMLSRGHVDVLLKNDQFLQQRQQRKVFVGYTEGSVTFQPTYKFDPGTDNWDTSEKARAPAWTDRILWKGEPVEQKAYRSHAQLRISDHKPVSAVFTAGIKVVDTARYRRIYEDVMKELDKMENEFLPQVAVDTTEINLGDVGFVEPHSASLTVANTGQVPVQFEFIKKLDDKSFCKAWMAVEPNSGFIMPGDKCEVSIEVMVGKRAAGALTCGRDQLYDILILHLVGGKDIFVTVSGTYKRSSFGSSIDALVRMTVPISELTVGQIMHLETGSKSDTTDDADGKVSVDEPYPVPKELWYLCDLITGLGLAQESLFLQPGLRAEILRLRDWLDTGVPVTQPDDVSIHSAAETLLLFVESLREPVIPYSMYHQCLECAGNYLQCRQIVAQLPAAHRQVFNYLCHFLREVLRFSALNGTDPKILSTLFASIMLRDPPGINVGSGIRARTQQQLLDSKKARFVYHFLVNESTDEP